VVQEIEGLLTPDQVKARMVQAEKLLETGGDIYVELADQRVKMEHEELRRMLPGYVRHFIEKSAPLLDIGLEGDLDGIFALRPRRRGAMDLFWPVLESYKPEVRERLTVFRPLNTDDTIFLHPGEPVFECFRSQIQNKYAESALKGAVFVDPYAEAPYFFHVALVKVIRKSDPETGEYKTEELLDLRLVGLRQDEFGEISQFPVEHLMLLRAAEGIPPEYISFASTIVAAIEQGKNYLMERVAMSSAQSRKQSLLDSLPERLDFIARGYAYQEAELAITRAKLSEKATKGDIRARGELAKVKQRQRELSDRKGKALTLVQREPELIVPDEPNFLAHTLVIPSQDPEDKRRHDREVEKIAVRVAWAFEESRGRTVKDVSTAEFARMAGLDERPGFDLLSRHPEGEERAIEVKGRAAVGDVELSENEWAKACNLRERYWLYVVYDCASACPRLLRIRDPFRTLLVRNKGGVIIGEEKIFASAEPY
jgi:hypothetical protein